MSNGQQLLRAVKPEASITIDGKIYNVGGLYGQTENAYLLPEWLDKFKANENDFHLLSYDVSELKPFLNRKSRSWSSNDHITGGKLLSFTYSSAILKDIFIKVNYELYDGIPLIVKWISVENKTNHVITIGNIINESLALVEEESAVVGTPDQMKKQHGIYVETNYAFNNAMRYDISDQTTHWKTDSIYTSQVNYNYQTPCLLEVYPEKVTAVELLPGEVFKSVRTHELLMDSYDRERRGLAIRKMYRAVAPWTNENPIFMHLVSKDDQQVKDAINQCAATGYEALILSFGSHCNMEDSSVENIKKWKALADYAHSKNILIGGYSLFSSRQISDEDDVIDPVTGKPDVAAFFGHAPCLGSKWGLAYINTLKYFISKTGFDIFENDGPYPGDVCASVKHPGHKNLDDSQWKQMELQKGLYHWCNENGVYVNAPDWYFLDGTNKIAIGYREVNFSLPRENQKILNRQNIYDGLWAASCVATPTSAAPVATSCATSSWPRASTAQLNTCAAAMPSRSSVRSSKRRAPEPFSRTARRKPRRPESRGHAGALAPARNARPASQRPRLTTSTRRPPSKRLARAQSGSPLTSSVKCTPAKCVRAEPSASSALLLLADCHRNRPA
ncbi:MAG: hypothetical protein QM756_16120 [Polyangiaceae bacterium]